MNKYMCMFGEKTIVYFGSLHWWQRCCTRYISEIEHFNEGEVNFGPQIDLNAEEFCPTVKDTTMAKLPIPVGAACFTIQDTTAMEPLIMF